MSNAYKTVTLPERALTIVAVLKNATSNRYTRKDGVEQLHCSSVWLVLAAEQSIKIQHKDSNHISAKQYTSVRNYSKCRRFVSVHRENKDCYLAFMVAGLCIH